MSETVPKGPDRAFPEKLNNCTLLFGVFSPALLFAFLALRIMEFVCILLTNAPPPDIRYVIGQAFLSDVMFFPVMLSFLFIPFVIVCFGTRAMKTRYRIWFIGGITIILLYATLIKYFVNAQVPLGADLYGYSLKEIIETIRNSVTINTATTVLYILPILVFRASFSFLYSRKLLKPGYALVLLGSGALLACTASVLPARASYKTELSQNLALNKAVYFVEESCSYLTRLLTESGVAYDPRKDEEVPGDVQASKYINPDYPFLRVDKTPDVLGEFFNTVPSGRPNIVFILVEGLGRSFSGPNARLASFTPFLDELSTKSIYWENFLATQGRTFGALPSILASLPFAEKGFTNLGERMPNHLSLMRILKHDGYRIKYYMSSDPEFDNEGLFLRRQGVDLLVGLNDFGGEYQKGPGIDWNYPDGELMRKTLKMESLDQNQPFVSFIQTISMHSRYSVPHQRKYLHRFEERMTRLGFNETQKEEHRLYADKYSTIMYTDDALRFFFREYAKLPVYQKTIFIVTGDHRLPEIPMITKIERYHVPLIIYSPLLKHTAHIRSVSSHLDITPSLLAYLHRNYSLEVPSTVTWVGTGLDTDPSFRNIHSYSLKQTKANLVDYISGMYFINHNNLFQVIENMDLKPIQDEVKRKQLIEEFDQYKKRNNRFIRELKLIPDSLYLSFAPKPLQIRKIPERPGTQRHSSM